MKLLVYYPNSKLENKEMFVDILSEVFKEQSSEDVGYVIKNLIKESPRFMPNIGVFEKQFRILKNRRAFKKYLDIKEKEQLKIEGSGITNPEMQNRIQKLISGVK